jgi:catechol 2,3-dioxygenase-like lactoylglutathione lyase family enzyme
MRMLSGLALLLLAGGVGQGATPERPAITGVSHLAVYAADADASERFYVHELGATKGADPENASGTRYYFSPTQWVEVLPLPPGEGINRLAHAAFTTADADQLRLYLKSKGFAVPAAVSKGSDGSRWFDVRDPEGTPVQFIQPPATAPAVPANPLSSRIIHVGFIIHKEALEDSFWRAALGFRPYWKGGFDAAKPQWISMKVPDGTDWLEYMVVGSPDGRGIPADMSQADLGVLDHFALGVKDMRVAYTILWNGKRLETQKPDVLPKIGLDAKWQLNLIDPDGTRAEFMEFDPIGTPCCSPFTAESPAS